MGGMPPWRDRNTGCVPNVGARLRYETATEPQTGRVTAPATVGRLTIRAARRLQGRKPYDVSWTCTAWHRTRPHAVICQGNSPQFHTFLLSAKWPKRMERRRIADKSCGPSSPISGGASLTMAARQLEARGSGTGWDHERDHRWGPKAITLPPSARRQGSRAGLPWPP